MVESVWKCVKVEEGAGLFSRGCSGKPLDKVLLEAEVPGKPVGCPGKEPSRQRRSSSDAVSLRRKCKYLTTVGTVCLEQGK